MADSTGVQVFVGPANQLELGTVTEGPTAVTLETVSDRLQRLNFSISAPTAEVLAEAEATAGQAAASAASAAGAQTSAQAAAASAAAAVTQAANSATAAAGSAASAVTAQGAATAAAAAAAASAAPTDAQLNAVVQQYLLPSNLSLDTDGVPFINPGANGVFVYADTDGRPYFVS